MMDVSATRLREALATALGVSRWVDEVAAAAPFESYPQFRAVASAAATPLSPAEIAEAVAHHPRIGEKPAGASESEALSRREQSSADADDLDVNAAIAAGNVAYEQRFDRVFLIRAAGRSRAEILSELHRRLLLDDDAELAIVGEQLHDIALLRLDTLLGPDSQGTAS